MTTVQSLLDIGVLNRLRILCISETGWFDTKEVFDDIRDAGGAEIDQYAIPWPPFGDLHKDNAAGFAALLEAETADGAQHRVLFDTGWNPAWMDKRFAEEGIDQLLKDGQIEALVISHEHFDHFWGIGSTLRHCPHITLYIPEGFHPKGLTFIKEQGHTGRLITIPPDQPLLLFPGLAIVNFPMHTLLRVDGENVLYARIRDRGMAMMTGCGHGGVLNLLDYARRTFQGGDRIHALYGGLHIAPLEDWDESRDRMVESLGQYGIAKLACNHCTGRRAVEKMLETGLPVLRGSARNGSQNELFVGNGDVVELA
ncbi:MAG: MBL fold metallo-hydrolase [Candidatus Competibacteraceae bacterium]|nr:MBL fold metallo-hydrolase [Candidatus Competibacteraceae bacterium]